MKDLRAQKSAMMKKISNQTKETQNKIKQLADQAKDIKELLEKLEKERKARATLEAERREKARREKEQAEIITAEVSNEKVEVEQYIYKVVRLTQDKLEKLVNFCKENVEKSTGIVTAMAPYIGYQRSAFIAKESLATGASVRSLILRDNIMTEEELNEIVDARGMTEPRAIKVKEENK
jgi:ATPase subunit of ABC transporter with duplicated ATPase domains